MRQRRFDRRRVRVRVRSTGAIEVDRWIVAKAVLGRIEAGVLAGKDERRRQAALGERVGDGSELDGFGSGADDQPYVRGIQLSP